MPNALLRLDLWLSAFVGDLREITNIIRSDIGLTAQVLRLAAREIEKSPGEVHAISDVVVLVGVEKLRALVAETKSVPDHDKDATTSRVCARFWKSSRLTALIAEELAYQSAEIDAEEAYVAGLLYRLGDLQSVFGWVDRNSETRNSRQIGFRMAQLWGFPRDLVDVIGGDREACRTRKSRALLDVVTDADIWALRLEFLAARECRSAPTRSPR